jgi:NAD(P)-dependent dehydrogenase (short-subunit alcohol dehydrogenase family)
VETEEEVWDEVLDVNLKGIYLASKYAIPEMRERGGGAIVNLSSVQAFASQRGVAAYTASKGAINALTRAMALDHAEENIRVNAICPAYVRTPLVDAQIADQAKANRMPPEEVIEKIMLAPAAVKRLIEPEEVAAVVSFLLSEDARAITGVALHVDLGWTAR